MRRLAFLGGCLLLTAACAGGGAYRPNSGSLQGTASRDVIRIVDHPELRDLDAYRLVQRLRPFSLQSRGPTSALLPSSRVTVFVNEMPIGDVSELASISARDIREIRFLSTTEAVVRYGRRFAGGIIKLVTW